MLEADVLSRKASCEYSQLLYVHVHGDVMVEFAQGWVATGWGTGMLIKQV